MPRVTGSSQAVLHMQQYGSRDPYANSGILGNTSIASHDRMLQTKETYGAYQRATSNDSTRSVRSTDGVLPVMQQHITRKPPQKTISYNATLRPPPPAAPLPRVVSDQFEVSPKTTPSPRTPEKRRRYNASESGGGNVLPITAGSNHNRSRTSSLSNLVASPFRRSSESHVTRSLRKRGKGSVQSDDEGHITIERATTTASNGGQRHSWTDSDDFSHHKNEYKPRHRSFSSLISGNKRLINMKSFHWIVLGLLFCVACFTASSYRKVFDATNQLVSVQRGESMMLLHLHKLEEQLIELHNYIRHLTDRSDGSFVTTGGPKKLAVDSDLLDIQMRKLREMEAELDHEVRTLQSRLSESAKRSIVNNFGEGAVQVDLDISFGANDNVLVSNTISIRLWHDTPHSAWTFLQQVENGSWNGSKFSAYHGRALLIQNESGGEVSPQVDFIERSKTGHDKFTVGLTDSGIILNTQDNRDFFKKEASVGIIVSGFDTLRQIVNEVEGQHGDSAIIRQASVSHQLQKG